MARRKSVHATWKYDNGASSFQGMVTPYLDRATKAMMNASIEGTKEASLILLEKIRANMDPSTTISYEELDDDGNPLAHKGFNSPYSPAWHVGSQSGELLENIGIENDGSGENFSTSVGLQDGGKIHTGGAGKPSGGGITLEDLLEVIMTKAGNMGGRQVIHNSYVEAYPAMMIAIQARLQKLKGGKVGVGSGNAPRFRAAPWKKGS